jgi:hypothetical protein
MMVDAFTGRIGVAQVGDLHGRRAQRHDIETIARRVTWQAQMPSKHGNKKKLSSQQLKFENRDKCIE